MWDNSGYNSDDEPGGKLILDHQSVGILFEQRLVAFERVLGRECFVKKVARDGNCLFRSVSDQVLGDENQHTYLRAKVCDYLIRNRSRFEGYITEDFDTYVNRKKNDKVHGNHVELRVISEMLGLHIRVFQMAGDAITYIDISDNTADRKRDMDVIKLAYLFNHYDSVSYPSRSPLLTNWPSNDENCSTFENTIETAVIKASDNANLEYKLLETAQIESLDSAIMSACERESKEISDSVDSADSVVEALVLMGFMRSRAEEAVTLFADHQGTNLENCIAFLIADNRDLQGYSN